MNRSGETGGATKQLPWDENLPKVSERLRVLLSTGWRSDVTVHVQGVQMKAHRLILAMNSAVLREQLFDQNETASNSELILADESPEAFYAVLEYMYGGFPSLDSVPFALKVSDLAVKFQLEELHSACSVYIAQNIQNARDQVGNAGHLPQETSAGGSRLRRRKGDQVCTVDNEAPPRD
nr:protein maternal effect lethal 26-like [Penaeus vannamei]